MKGFIVSSIAVAVLIIIVFLISGCVGEGASLDFETIAKGPYSNYITSQELVINDQGTLSQFFIEAFVASGAPIVNFSDSTVVAVFMGEKTTGGYEIEITSIIDYGNKVIVTVKRTSPGENCGVTQALTQPYHIVKTRKITKQVTFEYEDEVTECNAASFCDEDPIEKCDGLKVNVNGEFMRMKALFIELSDHETLYSVVADADFEFPVFSNRSVNIIGTVKKGYNYICPEGGTQQLMWANGTCVIPTRIQIEEIYYKENGNA